MNILALKAAEWKRKCEEAPAEALEEVKKKAAKDLELVQKRLQEAEASRERSERSKKKLQQEVVENSCIHSNRILRH